RQERSAQALPRLQHLRPRRDVQGSARAGDLVHDRRAGGDGRRDDGDQAVAWRGRVQHGTARSRSVPRGRCEARPALARRRAMSKGAALGEAVARAIDVRELETPCFVTDLGALEANLKTLASVAERAECTILLALKGFAQWSTFSLVKKYLAGA